MAADDVSQALAEEFAAHVECEGEISVDRTENELVVHCEGCGRTVTLALPGLAAERSHEAAVAAAQGPQPPPAMIVPEPPPVEPPPAPPEVPSPGASDRVWGSDEQNIWESDAHGSEAIPPAPERPAADRTGLERADAEDYDAETSEVGAEGAEPDSEAEGEPYDSDQVVAVPVGLNPAAQRSTRGVAALALLGLTVVAAIVVAVAIQGGDDGNETPRPAATAPSGNGSGGGAGGTNGGAGKPDGKGQSGGKDKPGAKAQSGGKGAGGGTGRPKINVGPLTSTLAFGRVPVGLPAGWRETGPSSEGGIVYAPSGGDATVTVFVEDDSGYGADELAERTVSFLEDRGIAGVELVAVRGGVGLIRGRSAGVWILARTSIDGVTSVIGVATVADAAERRRQESRAILESLPG